jgi:cytidine deaminase
MKHIEKTVSLTVLNNKTELWEADMKLLDSAHIAALSAYAPYSTFYVGAALLLENGEIITGNNQENAAYPSGLCAERVALFYAGAQFPGLSIEAIAITARSANQVVNNPVMSCGGCLQAMIEYENRQQKPIRVIMQGEVGDIYIAKNLSQLIPFSFQSIKTLDR